MKKFAALCALLLATGGPALAADPVYSHASAYDWSGLWVGAEGGYVSGNATNTPVTPNTLSGADFALRLHYNYQTADNWVISPFAVVPLPAATATIGGSTAKIDWALVGGVRLGYAIDRWLPYALVGGIVGGGTWSSFSATHYGYTVGLGFDYAITDRWSVGGRYAYVSMSQEAYGGVGSFGWDAHSTVATLNFKLY